MALKPVGAESVDVLVVAPVEVEPVLGVIWAAPLPGNVDAAEVEVAVVDVAVTIVVVVIMFGVVEVGVAVF